MDLAIRTNLTCAQIYCVNRSSTGTQAAVEVLFMLQVPTVGAGPGQPAGLAEGVVAPVEGAGFSWCSTWLYRCPFRVLKMCGVG